MSDYVIETKNLTKQYGTQMSVSDLNIHVKKGRIYGLLGRNGAGKTTTMKMLLGLTAPTSGEVVILRNNEVINATDETYGKDANTILREVMEVSSRPDIIRFLFEKFYELLDSGEWKMAEEIIGQLEKEIGNNDPEINACRVRLELEQM